MKAIVIVDNDWGISKNGEILFHIREDLQRLRKLTMGGAVIMGRITLESLPGKAPLMGRHNFILSTTMPSRDDATVCSSVEELLAKAPGDSWVLGGQSVYEQLLPWCTQAFVTKVNTTCGADQFFPNLDVMADWALIAETPPFHSGRYSYKFVTYHREA